MPLLAGLLALGAVACGDGGDGSGDGNGGGGAVDVQLTEYIVSPDPDSIAAGLVTFNARNIGGQEHELKIIRTDLGPDALPTADDGSADEAGAGITVLGTIEAFAPQSEESVTLDLAAGAYALICNLVDEAGRAHYAEGMSAAFTVTE
jgi:hypothetical protein